MMLIKSLISSVLLAAASSAFAVSPVVRSNITVLDDTQVAGFRVWSSVCVGNLTVANAVSAQYRYGDQGDWTAIKFEKNVYWLFSQRYTTDIQPYKLSVKFMNKAGTDAQELSYDLNQSETRLRPRACGNLENYQFQATDAPEPVVDLVHVAQP